MSIEFEEDYYAVLTFNEAGSQGLIVVSSSS